MADRKGVALAVATAFTWALAGIWVRLLAGLSSVFITGMRLVVALVALTPVLFLRRRHLQWRNLRNRWAYVLAALLITYYITAVIAFQYTVIAEVSLLIAASPLLVLGFNTARGEKVSRGEKLGALCAICGVAMVLGPKLAPGSFDLARLTGDLLSIASAACAATFATLSVRLNKRDENIDPFMVTTLTLVIGGIVLLSLSSFFTPQDFGHLYRAKYLVPALGLGIITTAFPSVAYSAAAKRLPAVVTTTIQLLIPIVSTSTAALVLGEVPSLWVLPGGVLVLAGIYTLVRSTSSSEAAIEEELTNV